MACKEEIAWAARELSRSLNLAIKTSQTDVDAFQTTRVSELRARYEELRQKAAEKYTLRVQETTDDAETFITDLNTHQTLAVQQVSDAIDHMLRVRRRRLRWLRRIGFSALEWLLLGIMWGVWFVVIVLKAVKGAFGGLIHGVRWLIWV